ATESQDVNIVQTNASSGRLPKSSTRYSNSSSGFSSAKSEISDSSCDKPSSLITAAAPKSHASPSAAASSPKLPSTPNRTLTKKTQVPKSLIRRRTVSPMVANGENYKMAAEYNDSSEQSNCSSICSSVNSSLSDKQHQQKTTRIMSSAIPSFGAKGAIPKPTLAVKGMKPVNATGEILERNSLSRTRNNEQNTTITNTIATSVESVPEHQAIDEYDVDQSRTYMRMGDSEVLPLSEYRLTPVRLLASSQQI
uniref:Uncharacterized protein n=1 Tax=Romanomermis culicivorax TaxID=13658 RepID=A0A915K2Z5_ROMCU